jgi:ubiquinone/menaquinone biosynthesis C-methylase UbiE
MFGYWRGGGGDLLKQISSAYRINASACDYHIERFDNNICTINKVDLNKDKLPYDDNYFDLVTCSEVFEHLENYRFVARDAFRVLKKDGILVVTTPNVLNMKSRIRYFISGFANMFGPLPARTDDYYSTGKHITPIPYFYLAHALIDAGFDDIRLNVDKLQKSSLFYMVLLFPLLWPLWKIFLYYERRGKTLTNNNLNHVSRHFTIQIMAGRTIILSAIKI